MNGRPTPTRGKLKTNGNLKYPNTWKVKLAERYRGQIEIGLTDKISPALREKVSEGLEVAFEVQSNRAHKVRLVGENAAIFDQMAKQEENRRAQGKPSGSQPASGNAKRPAGEFYNPYNFIPAPSPRDGVFDGPLGHHKPVGHDRYHEDLWSGRISVEIEVKTPLLIPDAIPVRTLENGHKIFPLRLDAEEKPYIPPTSLKGAIRSAYEAVTNSRMGVLEDHDTRLAHRMPPGDGLAMIPAKVSSDGERLELWMGKTNSFPHKGNKNRWQVPGAMYAAWLPRYRAGQTGGTAPRALTLQDGSYPEHGQKVFCWLEKISKGQFEYWRVAQIRLEESQLSKNPPRPWQGHGSHRPVGASMIRAVGWVCITNQNFGRKHDERVFFTPLGQGVKSVPLSDELKLSWCHLVKNYQEIHEADIKKRRQNGDRCDEFLGRNPGKTAFSRHVCISASKNLGPDDLCYARVDQKGRITGLYPVMISRELAECAPRELISETVRPAQSLDELSSADRVFGWVNQNGKGSYRGQFRPGPVRCLTERRDAIQYFGDDGLPLAILSTPKTQQARFYVGRDKETGAAQNCGLSKRQADYSSGKGIRGRKVYPHHKLAAQSREYWDGPAAFAESGRRIPDEINMGNAKGYREYIRRAGSDGNQTDQNRSMTEWVKPGTRFETWFEVTNLNREELGALLWLLSLPEGHYHRLGAGKPLGFGSVRISLTGLDLVNGRGKKRQYSSLKPVDLAGEDAVQTVEGKQRFTQSFSSELEKIWGPFDNISFVKSFLKAAEGGDKPVHYPRGQKTPNADEENFKWFVDNEHPNNGKKLTLGDLSDDPGLPFYQQSNANWTRGRGAGSFRGRRNR